MRASADGPGVGGEESCYTMQRQLCDLGAGGLRRLDLPVTRGHNTQIIQQGHR